MYRIQFIPVAEFINEFQELLEDFTVPYEDFFIAGDVNIHVESDESSSRKFKYVLEMSNSKHVTKPTAYNGFST